MDRRQFIKTSGAGAAALGITACGIKGSGKNSTEPLGKMLYNMDGVSSLGYGCMRWPTVENADGIKEIDQEAVNQLVDRALEAGVNYFDTAPLYVMGKSEQATATALLRHPRESYFLATKCSNYRNTAYPFEAGYKMYQRSRDVFQTDYIDYYLLHCITSFEDFQRRFVDNGLLEYFMKEREEGRIKHLGWSYHGDQKGFDAVLATHPQYHWDFVQIQMNYVDWRHTHGDVIAEHMYTELEKLDIPVVIMEPLLGGQLSDVPAAVHDMLKEQNPSQSIASWAFRFCGSFPRILTTLSGMTYMEHLEDNLRTFCNFEPLTPEQFQMLEQAAIMIREYPTVDCTSCQYCMPCPYGIDIPGIFNFYNSQIKAGTYVVSNEQKRYNSTKRKYLLSYNKAVPTVRQASHCIGCNMCEHHCPQGIKIALQMQRIDRYIEKLKQDKL